MRKLKKKNLIAPLNAVIVIIIIIIISMIYWLCDVCTNEEGKEMQKTARPDGASNQSHRGSGHQSDLMVPVIRATGVRPDGAHRGQT